MLQRLQLSFNIQRCVLVFWVTSHGLWRSPMDLADPSCRVKHVRRFWSDQQTKATGNATENGTARLDFAEKKAARAQAKAEVAEENEEHMPDGW